jgi:hypothetical protein
MNNPPAKFSTKSRQQRIMQSETQEQKSIYNTIFTFVVTQTQKS